MFPLLKSEGPKAHKLMPSSEQQQKYGKTTWTSWNFSFSDFSSPCQLLQRICRNTRVWTCLLKIFLPIPKSGNQDSDLSWQQSHFSMSCLPHITWYVVTVKSTKFSWPFTSFWSSCPGCNVPKEQIWSAGSSFLLRPCIMVFPEVCDSLIGCTTVDGKEAMQASLNKGTSGGRCD